MKTENASINKAVIESSVIIVILTIKLLNQNHSFNVVKTSGIESVKINSA